MQHPRYALVAYLRNDVGDFIRQLRKDLHPDLPHLPAHLTILPPRSLSGSEPSAVGTLEEICGRAEPFDVHLGDVETFLPVTSTVFIGIQSGADHMRALHDKLTIGALIAQEEWPYVPHLTIVQASSESLARQAYATARERWAKFPGSRRIPVKELTFVREEEENRWIDLAGLRLGSSLVNH